MICYYLGIPVEVERLSEDPGWVWAWWPNGRCYKHWAGQLKATPWGEF